MTNKTKTTGMKLWYITAVITLVCIFFLMGTRAVLAQEVVTDLRGNEVTNEKSEDDAALSEAPTCTIQYHEIAWADNSKNATTYTSGKKLKLKSATKTGYKFLGWHEIDANGNWIRIKTIKRKVTSSDVIHLYAKWEPARYKITYKIKNGKSGDNPKEYTVESATIVLQEPDMKPGMSFDGWYQDKKLTIPITEIPRGTMGKKTIYAKTSPIKYTVTYDANGGTGNTQFPGPQTYSLGKKFTIPMIYAVKPGYTAIGFNTKADGTGQFYQSNKKVSDIAKKSGPITLYIDWRKTTDLEKQYAQKVVELVNAERKKNGLAELDAVSSGSKDIQTIAMQRARDISVSANHNRPDGTAFRLWRQKFGTTAALSIMGENYASGYATPEAVVKGWMNSSGHRANILNNNYGKIGVGCYIDNGNICWIQDFAY